MEATVTSRLALPVPILMYHEIAGPAETTSRLAVPPYAWAEQLAYLHYEGYRTITAAELSAALVGRRQLPDRAVVLTFDDGYADFHSRAMPLLDRYGFTATLFVTTGWIQGTGPHATGRTTCRMLSWAQIAEAANAGIEVAAHSRLHPQLDQLPRKLLHDELYTSKAQLEDKLGSSVIGLAYPFGYSDIRVRQIARDLGHDYACAVGNVLMDNEPDLLALPRLTVKKSMKIAAFQQVVHGSAVQRIYFTDRMLTKGWAMVRRTRAVLGGLSRRE
jgi:peptidoglycan/xylan/chitin deacetylase (PgdA/CDA1 family)